MFWRKPQSALEKPLHSTAWKRAPEKEKGNWQNKACQRWFFEAKSVKFFFLFSSQRSKCKNSASNTTKNFLLLYQTQLNQEASSKTKVWRKNHLFGHKKTLFQSEKRTCRFTWNKFIFFCFKKTISFWSFVRLFSVKAVIFRSKPKEFL